MSKLTFRSCLAKDQHRFAILSDQEGVINAFDTGYKNAYRDGSNLANWAEQFTAESRELDGLLPDSIEVSDGLRGSFHSCFDILVKGVDVMFLDYNFGIEGDRATSIEVLDNYKSTDFILFSHDKIIGEDPYTQPYMVSYNVPRYDHDANSSGQHRIYCRTDPFAFQKAISAIISQRERQNLTGGHIRADYHPYIADAPATQETATKVLNEFADKIELEEQQANQQASHHNEHLALQEH